MGGVRDGGLARGWLMRRAFPFPAQMGGWVTSGAATGVYSGVSTVAGLRNAANQRAWAIVSAGT